MDLPTQYQLALKVTVSWLCAAVQHHIDGLPHPPDHNHLASSRKVAVPTSTNPRPFLTDLAIQLTAVTERLTQEKADQHRLERLSEHLERLVTASRFQDPHGLSKFFQPANSSSDKYSGSHRRRGGISYLQAKIQRRYLHDHQSEIATAQRSSHGWNNSVKITEMPRSPQLTALWHWLVLRTRATDQDRPSSDHSEHLRQ